MNSKILNTFFILFVSVTNCLSGAFDTINNKQEFLTSSEPEKIEIVHGTLGIKEIIPEKQILPMIHGSSSPFLMFQYPEPMWRASAILKSNLPDENGAAGGKKIQGNILFHQWNPNNFVRVTVNATGVPKGKHAIHIHMYGDLSDSCKSTGSHFQSNFIGNIEAKDDGEISISFFSTFLNMFGYYGIIGRSVVIHEKPIEAQALPPDSFYSPLMVSNTISFQTEEMTVGSILACGAITITENRNN